MIRTLSVMVALCVAPALAAQQTAIRFGSLVDGSGRVLRDAVVVTNADTIVSVGTGSSAVPRGARVIDLRRYTGIPGMIDAHTHISGRVLGDPGDPAIARAFRIPETENELPAPRPGAG